MAMDMAAFGRFARTFQAGEMIFSEFEPGGTFYLIQSGRVELVKIIGDIEKTLDILQPSEMFGEMALLENSPRSATAIALDTVKVLEFNQQNFEILMMGNPKIALTLLKMFTKRIYDSKRRYMILTLDDDQAKIADVFLMLDETQTNIDKTTDRREFKTSVDDIAHWAGMSVTQARDIVNHFVTQRRVELFNDKIAVKNINDFSRFVASKRKKT
jgi:CRP-like cAMP-binding protein